MRTFNYDFTKLPNHFLIESESLCEHLDQPTRIRYQGATIGFPDWNLLHYAALCSLPHGRPVTASFGGNFIFFDSCSWSPPGIALWQSNRN